MDRGDAQRARRRTVALTAAAGALVVGLAAVQATSENGRTGVSGLPVSAGAAQGSPPAIDVGPAVVTQNVGPFTVGRPVGDGDVEPSCDFPSRGWGADWQPRERLNKVSFSAAVNTTEERPVHFTGLDVRVRSVRPSHHPSLLYCPPDPPDTLPPDTHVYTARVVFEDVEDLEDGEPDITYVPLLRPGKPEDEADLAADDPVPGDLTAPGRRGDEVERRVRDDEEVLVLIEASTTAHTEVVWEADALFRVGDREVRVPVAPDQGPFVVSDGGEGANALLWNGEHWQQWRLAEPPEPAGSENAASSSPEPGRMPPPASVRPGLPRAPRRTARPTPGR